MTRPRRTAGRWWLPAAPAIAFLVAVVAFDVSRDVALVLTNLGQLSAVGWAVVRCRAGARTADARHARAWRCFALAGLGWGLAQATFGFHEVVLGRDAPDVVQLGYLTSVPLAMAAVLTFFDSPANAVGRVIGTLEALLVATAVMGTAWVLVLRELFQEVDGDTLSRVIAVSFPAVEVLVGALVLFVAGRSRPGTRVQLVMVAGGVGCFLAADLVLAVRTLHGTYETATWTDIGWMAAWVIVGLAPARQAPVQPAHLLGDDVVGLLSRLTVLVPVATGLATCLLDLRTPGHEPVTGAVLLTVVGLLLLHAVASAWEKHRFTGYLEDEVARRTEALAASEAFVRTVLAHSSEVVLVVGADGTVQHLTESLWGALGWDGERFLGKPATALVDPRDAPVLEAALARAEAEPGRPTGSTVRTFHADGSLRTMDLTLVALPDEVATGAVVVNARDVTDRIALEEELAHLAFHDDLTGLPNRTLLRDRIDRALAGGREVGVLFVDLDGFKGVNDGLGHAAGDELLAAVARRLLAVLPGDGCTLARLGGDEFGILVVGGADEALALADEVLAALQEPHVIEGRELPIRASIGVATTATASTSTDLLRDADVAMYGAKAAGRSRVELFTPAMHDAALAELELGADLTRAVGRGELRVVYQPLVDLADGQIVGVEALLRWDHPTLGPVPPSTFVPLAERNGAIVEIGAWVLAEAAAQALAWRRRHGDRAPKVSVNVSGRQLAEATVVRDVVETVEAAGARPAWLALELTESVLVDSVDDAIVGRLADLRTAGFGIAVDDFGTGYSALSYLHRLPVDELKIDRSFVQALEAGGDDAGLVRMILELADALSLSTVAEGIETEAQRDLLAGLGCDAGQGYLFARPGPAAEVDRLLLGVPAT